MNSLVAAVPLAILLLVSVSPAQVGHSQPRTAPLATIRPDIEAPPSTSRFPEPLATENLEDIATVNTPIEKGFNGDHQETSPEIVPSPRGVATAAHKNTGFIDLNYYWDTRELTVFTLNAGAKLPQEFEYFQFLNTFSPVGSNETDEFAYYTEINLRRPIQKQDDYLTHLDWTIQYADGTFAESVARAGVRWRFHDTPGEFGRFVKDVLKLRMGVSFHALESDGSGWQMEYAYRRDFCDKRIYIGGFADHNIDDGGRSTWVTENQVGVQLFDQWHAVAEYRYTTFAPRRDRSGLGVGLEYVILFR